MRINTKLTLNSLLVLALLEMEINAGETARVLLDYVSKYLECSESNFSFDTDIDRSSVTCMSASISWFSLAEIKVSAFMTMLDAVMAVAASINVKPSEMDIINSMRVAPV